MPERAFTVEHVSILVFLVTAEPTGARGGAEDVRTAGLCVDAPSVSLAPVITFVIF